MSFGMHRPQFWPIYYCPHCPPGTELVDNGTELWCPAEQAVIPWAEIQDE